MENDHPPGIPGNHLQCEKPEQLRPFLASRTLANKFQKNDYCVRSSTTKANYGEASAKLSASSSGYYAPLVSPAYFIFGLSPKINIQSEAANISPPAQQDLFGYRNLTKSSSDRPIQKVPIPLV
jgi:hypothetical protein